MEANKTALSSTALLLSTMLNAQTGMALQETNVTLPINLGTKAPFVIPFQITKTNTVITNVLPLTSAIQGQVRETTDKERLIGELRQLNLLDANWDGENATKPKERAIKDAVSFSHHLNNRFNTPETMLHDTGNVSLYWNTDNFYADIEFLGDGRVSYFIKKNEDKHKGVCKLNNEKMPAVLEALLKA